jgi:hypothetical protein
MKRYRVLTAVFTSLLLVTLLVSGCGTILVTEDGKAVTGETETRQYDLTEFTRVDISSAFTYEIKKADDYSISITANSDLFDDIRVVKRGQTLNIGLEISGTPWTIFNTNPNLRAVITMPQLQELESAGATHGTVTGFSSTEDLEVTASGASRVELQDISAGDTAFEVSGASTVTGDITAEDIEFEVSGASTVQLEGSAVDMAADVSGASHIKLGNLKVYNVDINLSGASNGAINLDGRLDVELSGASQLYYIGEPTLGTLDVTGGSKITES